MEIKLLVSVILDAVKSETYIKGTFDKVQGDAVNKAAYNEIAGDEEVHKRKLRRGIYTSADKLRSLLQDYIYSSTITPTIADNTVVAVDESTETITITLENKPRFNSSNADAIARLFSKFIEDNTLVLWWGALNQNQAAFYSTMLADDLTAIQRLFEKTAPAAPTIPYTENITFIDGTTSADVTIPVGDTETISYTLDSDVIDDVEIISDNNNVSISRKKGGFVTIKGVHSGVSHITLYSIHDESVYASVTAVVSGDGTSTYEEVPPFRPYYPRY